MPVWHGITWKNRVSETGPFVVYKHGDIDRQYLHIVTVRVDETGKKISDSFEKLRSMDARREPEIKYGLHPALKKERKFGENFIKKQDICGLHSETSKFWAVNSAAASRLLCHAVRGNVPLFLLTYLMM